MTLFFFAFIAVAFFSIYIQAKSHTLAAVLETSSPPLPELSATYRRLVAIRGLMTPGIGALAAALVAIGVFARGTGPSFLGILFCAVWACVALGDVFIEGSYAADDEATKERNYFLGMVLFVLVTLSLGVGLIVHAILVGGLPWVWALIGAAGALVLGLVAYASLDFGPAYRVILVVYTLSVTTLLCGGIFAAITGDPHLGYIGIAYFFADWFVGLRDFGKRVPGWLKDHALIVILILYYTVMLTSIDLVLSR